MASETRTPPQDSSSEIRKIELDKDHELRFEVEYEQTVTIKLIGGTAEMFGTELALEKDYVFSNGTKSAIFTWHGCSLEITGPCHSYIANETPMVMYMNAHSALEDKRQRAIRSGEPGPRVILVGPTDSGKSTISRILLGYAVRKGHSPTFVDLDIGQGSITIPGSISAVTVEMPVPVEDQDFSTLPPIAYYYGHVSPSENPTLYKAQITALAKDINRKFEKKEKLRASGLVINTCGWIDGMGYELLLHAINTFSADTVLVIDQERLYSDLNREYGQKLKVIKLAKSGGVVTRDPTYRRKSRKNRIKHYFYGANNDLCPHSTMVSFNDITIFKIGGGPQAPLSALPIGAESTQDPVKLVETYPSSDLVHSVLAVSHAKTAETVLESNVAGYLVVTEVNFDKRKITFLAPTPSGLPSKFLLLGSLKFLE